MRAESLGYVAAVVLAVAAGLALRWQVLDSGLITDDYVAEAILEGAYPGARGPLDLFNFIDGTPEDLQRHLDAGTFPWWSAPNLRLSMMRPLAALLIHADRALFGARIELYHAHSLAWWVLLMLAAATLLRSVLPASTAALALLIFALEEGHNLPVTWLANRSALAALAFGLCGVWLHVRWRRDAARWAAAASAASFGVALGFGEWAFPVLGYVAAYEALQTHEPAARRLRALLPAALLGLGFVALRAWLGYGVRGSGIYLDPVDEPAEFLRAAAERIPIFFSDLFFGISAEWWVLGSPWRDSILRLQLFTPGQWLRLPVWQFWHVTLGVTAMLTAGVVLRWGLRQRGASERAALRWLLLGGLLSLLPMVASFPTSRLVLPASLGASAALASVALDLARRVLRAGQAPLAALGSAALLGGIGYVQLYRPVPEARSYIDTLDRIYDSARAWVVQADLDPRTLAQSDVVVLAVAEQPSGFWAPLIRRYHGLTTPRSWRTLSAAPHAHDIARPADNVLELTALGGGFAVGELEKLYRTPRAPLPFGHTVRMAGMSVQVIEVVAGEARRIRVTFDRSLDDPSLVFLASTAVGLSRAPIPEVGGVRRLARAQVPDRVALEIDRRHRDPWVRCPGARPELAQCRNGFAFSDCDGRDEPAWACSYAGDCRWFVGGCVAAGYEPSTCPAERLGCHDGLPFDAHGLLAVPWVREANDRTLAAWGSEPFRPERALNLPVEIDAGLESGDALPLLRCAGPGPAGGPCWARGLDADRPLEQAGLLTTRLRAAEGAGWALHVEVFRRRDGQWRARVCRVTQQSGVVRSHIAPGAPDCAIAGALRLSRAPELDAQAAPALRLTARFADGGLVDAEL